VDEFLIQIEHLLDYIEKNGSGLNQATQQVLSELLTEVNDVINPEVEASLPTGASLLWHISGGNPEIFTNYLRQVPDQALNALLNSPPQLQQIIRRLQENQPQERNREIGGIPQAPLQSSNIWGFSYEPGSKKLFVRFQGDGVYEYDGVPPQIFNLFQQGAVPAKTTGSNNYGSWWVGKNPSLGASLFELIKSKGYPYQKVA